MLRNGLSRVCASINALLIFSILAPTFVIASLQPSEQFHFVCKRPESNWCVKWNLTKYFSNQLNVPNDIKTSKEFHQLCGISLLTPISPHKKFIKVNLLSSERNRFIFCKTSTMKNGGDYSSLGVLKAMATARVRRQTSITPRGRYRGQTQSQYLAVDHGNGKNEGKAEAHSAADSSRASVSGNSGMGQAQSQSIYDPSCDDCNGKTKDEAQFLQLTPGHANNGPTGSFPGYNKDNSGGSVNNKNLPGSIDENSVPNQYGYDKNNQNPGGINSLPSIQGNPANGGYPENDKRYFYTPTQGTGQPGGENTRQHNQANNIATSDPNGGVNPGQGFGSNIGVPNGYGSNPNNGNQGPLGNNNGYPNIGLIPAYNKAVGTPDLRNYGNNQIGDPNQAGLNQGGNISPDKTSGHGIIPNQGYGNNQGGMDVKGQGPNLNQNFGLPNSGVGYTNWPFLTGTFPDGSYYCCVVSPNKNQINSGPSGTNKNGVSGAGVQTDNAYQGPYTGSNYFPGTGSGYPGVTNSMQGENYNVPNNLLSPGTPVGSTGIYSNKLPASTGLTSGSPGQWNTQSGTPGGQTYFNQYGAGSNVPYNGNNVSPGGPGSTPAQYGNTGGQYPAGTGIQGVSHVPGAQGGRPGIQNEMQGPGGHYGGPGFQNGPHGASGQHSPEGWASGPGVQNGQQRPWGQTGSPSIQNGLLTPGQNPPSPFAQPNGIGGVQQIGVPGFQGGFPGNQGRVEGPIGQVGGHNIPSTGGQIAGPNHQVAYQGPGGQVGGHNIPNTGGQMVGPNHQVEYQGSGIYGPGVQSAVPNLQEGYQGSGSQGPVGPAMENGIPIPGGPMSGPGMHNGMQAPGGQIGGPSFQNGIQIPGGQMGEPGMHNGIQVPSGQIGGPGIQNGIQTGGTGIPNGIYGPVGPTRGPGYPNGIQNTGGQGGSQSGIQSPGIRGPGGNSGGTNFGNGIPGGIQGSGVNYIRPDFQGGVQSPGGQIGQGGPDGLSGRHMHGVVQNPNNILGPTGQGAMQSPGGRVPRPNVQGGLHIPSGQSGGPSISGGYLGPGGRVSGISGPQGGQMPESGYGSPGFQEGQGGYPGTRPSGTQGPGVRDQGNYGTQGQTKVNGELPNQGGYANQPGVFPNTGSNYPTQFGHGTNAGNAGNGVPQNVMEGNTITNVIDDDDSEAQASVSQADNGTIASASSKGGNDKGRAQTNVLGTYTGSGSFSAQAQINDENKAAESEVSGGKQGASSKAQGSGKKSKSQASVQLGSETGSIQTQSQSDGIMHSSNSQVQGSVKGGMADSQARGPGITSSQAQIGFTPYKEGDKSHDEFKTPFVGSGTSSAQSSGRTGQSQSQLHGTFKYGITYNGAAQAGASIDKDAVFPNRVNFEKINVFDEKEKNINVELAQPAAASPSSSKANENEPQEQPEITNSGNEHTSHSHYDHHTTESKLPSSETFTPEGSKRSFQTTYEPNSSDYEDKTDKDDNSDDYDPVSGLGTELEHEYPNFYEEENTHQALQSMKGFEVKQNTGGNSQHIILSSLKDQDAFITQRTSLRPAESIVYQPGEKVPGTGGYTIPLGFTGSVKSVASRDNTYVIGSKDSPSQAQTVSLKPGSGNVKYVHPSAYAKNVPSKDLKSLKGGKNDENRYVSVSKSVTRALDSKNNIQKQYSHTYYTKSSSCGYFTFTCTMVSGPDGRKKVCRPKIPTNPDGTPMRC